MYLIFGTEQQIEELRGKAGKALVHMIFKVICQKSRLRFFTKQFLFNKKKYCLILNKAKQKIVNIISFFLLCIYLQLWNFRPYEDYPYFRNIQKFIHIWLSIQIWIKTQFKHIFSYGWKMRTWLKKILYQPPTPHPSRPYTPHLNHAYPPLAIST